MARQRRAGISRHRDQLDAEPFDQLQEPDDFLRLAALGDRQDDVPGHHHSDISVHRLRGVQEQRRRTGTAEGGGDLRPDQYRLAHAGHDHASLAGAQGVHGAVERLVQAGHEIQDGLRLQLQNLARDGPGHQSVLTIASMASTCLRRGSTESSGREFGPSLFAVFGSSCTSQNRASMPTAAAARASNGMNSESPPLRLPRPPGCCTEWVASMITGYPNPRMIASDRKSTTRFW